jgi:hypothetical protein
LAEERYPDKDLTRARLSLAHLAVDHQIKCWQASRHLSDSFSDGKQWVKSAMQACADCGKACAQVAELCLQKTVPGTELCESCVRACESCAEECQKVNDDVLREVFESCRQMAKACKDMNLLSRSAAR